MRKLPIGPLLILIVMFLASHFANAQALPQSLPEKLPSKLPAKLPAKLPQKVSSKRAAVRGAKVVEPVIVLKPAPQKTKVALKAKAKAGAAATVASTLPKKLPSFKAKRVQINFEEIPSTPLDQSVVVMAPALEAPQDTNAIAAASIEELPQALPIKPPQAPEPPELASVERPFIEVLPSEPTNELWQQDPNAVAAQPLTEAGVRMAQPSEDDLETIHSATAGLSYDPLSIFNPSAQTAESVSSSTASVAEVTATAQSSATVSVESSPAVIESARLSKEPVEISAESAAPTTTSTTTSNSLSAIVESRQDEDSATNKLFIRAGYLSANYSDLAADLKDGASTFGFSYARSFTSWEAKASLDFAYGLDQEMSVRNTRMAIVRGEALYLFRSFGFIRPLVGAGLGLANIDVTSYRESGTSDDLILREHAQGTAFLISPQAGIRAAFSKSIVLDLTAQYLVLTGGENLSKLGGALLEASLGFGF